jgi:hypothetical protein
MLASGWLPVMPTPLGLHGTEREAWEARHRERVRRRGRLLLVGSAVFVVGLAMIIALTA